MRILVVGDYMLDEYIEGSALRLSPEAPVPVVLEKRRYTTLGGAGNVALNLRSLCSTTALIDAIGIIGCDCEGDILCDLLRNKRIGNRMVRRSSIITTKKTRVVTTEGYQIVRIDNETSVAVYPEISSDAYTLNLYNPDFYDCIILSDYGKGMVRHDIITALMDFHNCPIILDPNTNSFSQAQYKQTNLQNRMNNLYAVVPNEKEYSILKEQFCEVPNKIITSGPYGIYLHTDKNDMHFKANPISVYNVSGAGDTVAAVLAYGIANHWHLYKSIYIALRCGEYVVSLPGTATVPYKVFRKITKAADYKKQWGQKI